MSKHEDTQKKDEYVSLNAFLRLCKDPFAKILLGCQDISAEKQERPDIVLTSGDCIYGIEHISIPFITENGGDATKIHEARIERTFNKFRIDEEHGIDRYSGHEEEALHTIEDVMNRKLGSVTTFSYSGYIEKCYQLLFEKHDTLAYYTNLTTGFTGKEVRLCLLLDISRPIIPNTLKYKSLSTGKVQETVRNDYPFTLDFLKLLASLKKVHRILLFWHPERAYNDKKARCYVIDPTRIFTDEDFPAIWASFDFPDKYKHPWQAKFELNNGSHCE